MHLHQDLPEPVRSLGSDITGERPELHANDLAMVSTGDILVNTKSAGDVGSQARLTQTTELEVLGCYVDLLLESFSIARSSFDT